ncbi:MULTISPECIES: heme-binding protein [unclassified Pseudomonas]|uniref:GlcG/HbpS family heme-binding protein n=1 Tax=unclassified Pseudomonas TaxID=196821 RepID=UPI000D70160F|nr:MULTISPECIES: heme-binding protein [unclassified Pseudomonas]PWU29353.1 heme-binding protein [Pseudomonas sp. RW407]
MSHFLRQQTSLTLTLAMQALQAALNRAEELQARVSIVVVDASGLPVHSAHMDAAPAPSRDIALSKARTAAAFNLPTRDWQARLERCSDAVRQGLPLQPGLALYGGGEPLRLSGEVIGAIGVSGAAEELDCSCARAAVEHVRSLLQG